MAHSQRIKTPSKETAPVPADRLLAPFERFMRLEAAGGIVLIVMAVLAMIWANSAWGSAYTDLFRAHKFTVGFGAWALSKPLILWINDLLMALFFLLVGLEIKREILMGDLSTPKKAALPVAAALGGMVVPGVVYAAINWGSPTIRGWGVPMATDIAFALGVLALVGSRVPSAVRTFLTSLAIADDLGALIIIAVFYTEQIGLNYLALGGAGLAGLVVLNLLGFRRPLGYMLLGVLVWYFVLKSGVHATIAGVLVALTIPTRLRADQRDYVNFMKRMIVKFDGQINPDDPRRCSGEQQTLVLAIETAGREVQSPLRRLEQQLIAWVAFLILPIFALANAGVPIELGQADETSGAGRAMLGAALGLLIGKPLGVFGATWLAVKLRIGELPPGVRWRHIHGAAWLAGIGFTMALFIASLAFTGQPSTLDAAKLGVLGASVLAGIIGLVVLMTGPKKQEESAAH
ncbi:MAG: Na+/H+ antiporter NhaA [Leptolyngbya sp. PLA3]|nr:MAG: Na+/H+ antiporter NhaA [Cyanobacteria bacterium CYA]MCE7969940.1 Na+/H+ antiporter NhaA [Leptolyngbya sp. PL-A3]